MCTDDGVNYKDVCGEGGIGCKGSLLKPQCLCDTASWYTPSLDGRQCLPGVLINC